MIREIHPPDNWDDAMGDSLREQCLKDLNRLLLMLPQRSIFDPGVSDEEILILAGHSCYREMAVHLNPTRDADKLRNVVIKDAERCWPYLTDHEQEIIQMAMMEDGRLPLDDRIDLPAVISLIQRLWCHLENGGAGNLLVFPAVILDRLGRASLQPQDPRLRILLGLFTNTVRSLLHLMGLAEADQVVRLMKESVLADTPDADTLAQLYLIAVFDCCYINHHLILIHPGVADPFALIEKAEQSGNNFAITPELVADAQNGMLPEEKKLQEMLCGVLNGALRPDIDLFEVCYDLMILIKQDVPYTELETIVRNMLAVQMTPRMQDALTQMYHRVPRWMGTRIPMSN